MLQLDHFGGDGVAEGAVVLDEEHGGLVFLNQLFDLQAAGEVDVIQGFVPDIEMGLLAEAFGEEDFLLLAFGKGGHVAVEMIARKAHFAQEGEEEGAVDLRGFGEVEHAATEGIGTLGHIGDDEPAGDAHAPAVVKRLARQKPQQAGFAAAVGPVEKEPVAAVDGEGARRADGDTRVAHLHLFKSDETVGAVGERNEFQGLFMFEIFQQLGFFFDCALAAGFYGLAALHHLGSHVADVALVGGADLCALNAVGPVGGALGSLFELTDLVLQAGILLFFVGFTAGEIFLSGGIVAAVDLDVREIEREHMVDGGVEKMAVVAHEDEAGLVAEIARHRFATGEIEMVRWFIDEGKGRIIQKEPGQQRLGLFATGEGVEGPPENLVGVAAEQVQLAPQLPVLSEGIEPGEHVPRQQRWIGRCLWKIDEICAV